MTFRHEEKERPFTLFLRLFLGCVQIKTNSDFSMEKFTQKDHCITGQMAFAVEQGDATIGAGDYCNIRTLPGDLQVYLTA